MNGPTVDTLAAAFTLFLVALYEAWAAHARRHGTTAAARVAHAQLRADWFASVSAAPGTEILAVQTLRNSMMAASLTASTTILSLMGAIGLSAPSLHASFARGVDLPQWTPRLLIELAFFALLFASLLLSVLAIRYYHHASFIGGMPVGSATRARWARAGGLYVRRAGVFYSWSLRGLILALPLVAFLLHPFAGVLAAVVTVAVLHQFDRAHLAGDEPSCGSKGAPPC
jgi:uncharacterized membrane protein